MMYAGQSYATGESFEASVFDASVLKLTRLAQDAPLVGIDGLHEHSGREVFDALINSKAGLDLGTGPDRTVRHTYKRRSRRKDITPEAGE
jgi:hypothetical protein